MVLIGATPSRNVPITELEDAIWQEINQVKSSLVSDKELLRVKAQISAENVFQKDSGFYQAMSIGRLETIGLDWSLENEFLSRIKQVTAEQVQTVAKKYLVTERSTVASLKPLEQSKSKSLTPLER